MLTFTELHRLSFLVLWKRAEKRITISKQTRKEGCCFVLFTLLSVQMGMRQDEGRIRPLITGRQTAIAFPKTDVKTKSSEISISLTETHIPCLSALPPPSELRQKNEQDNLQRDFLNVCRCGKLTIVRLRRSCLSPLRQEMKRRHKIKFISVPGGWMDG